jgi:hypothetical protein
MPAWLDFLLRVLVLIGMAVGGYHAIKHARGREDWSTAALVLSSALFVAYICGAVAMFIVYGVFMAWDYLFVFLVAATFYVVVGFYGCWKLTLHMKARLPPKI